MALRYEEDSDDDTLVDVHRGVAFGGRDATAAEHGIGLLAQMRADSRSRPMNSAEVSSYSEWGSLNSMTPLELQVAGKRNLGLTERQCHQVGDDGIKEMLLDRAKNQQRLVRVMRRDQRRETRDLQRENVGGLHAGVDDFMEQAARDGLVAGTGQAAANDVRGYNDARHDDDAHDQLARDDAELRP